MVKRVRNRYRELRRLPGRVARFQFAAQTLCRVLRDRWTQVSSLTSPQLAGLLEVATGSQRVVELGTASGWTASSLVLADPDREVVTYDPYPAKHRGKYMRLAGSARQRIRTVNERGDVGPQPGQVVDLLLIDSSHEREDVVSEFHAWHDAVRPGGYVVFDDAEDPRVRAALIEDLKLQGPMVEQMLVWQKPG